MPHTLLVATAVLVAGLAVGRATTPSPAAPASGAPVARLFVQDLKSCSLKWADVRVGPGGKLALAALAAVPGFPKLDPARQKLVQMRESGSLLCVGVRDDDGGKLGSGWVLVQTGVGYADHGDHGHWSYKKQPAVADSRVGPDQGNPAHVYLYGGKFFVAHDGLDGYARIDPAKYATNEARSLGKGAPQFLAGGGGHITLAVADDKVGYACWIDGGGPNKGRVDVTPVTAAAKTGPGYSFHLPSGGIHGATVNSGKVFFAPAEGVCWVEADAGLKLKADQVMVCHIDLGKEGGAARRTGAFVNHGRHVLFVAGKDDPALVVLDARDAWPKPVAVPLAPRTRGRVTTPAAVTAADGKAYALLFHEAPGAGDALEVVALDPNGDGRLADARSVKTLAVGRNAVQGHFGHHDVGFDADRKHAFFTNPGDGTLSVLSLTTLDIVATFPVGGTPTALVVRGGEDLDD